MVNFSVFNELSLPIPDISAFKDFFAVISELRKLGLEKIRMDRNFTQYSEILPNTSFPQFIGQIRNIDQKRQILNFIKNGISVIETPLIKEDEKEQEELLINEYFYNNTSNKGALACSDIWNTITVSFLSDEQWNKDSIKLQKQTIEDKIIDIEIRHASNNNHLTTHHDFFQDLEKEKRLNITRDNFWNKREEFFPEKIIFCKEVEEQIKTIDKEIFYQAINKLRDIETDKKQITDFNYSSESKSVKDDETLKKLRYFSINDDKVYFDNHLKFSSYRIYFIEQDNKIYIGYIGKHLPTKKF